MSAPVPVNPGPVRARLLDFVRQLQAEALKYPDGSENRIFLLGQALGVYTAVREMTLELAAACDSASGPASLN